MRLKFTVPILLIAVTGCYRVTVVHGAPPASPVVVDRPWQHSFISGLVPPAEINVKDQCPTGVSRVETWQSFVNLVAQAATQAMYSPISVRVTCSAAASGSATGR